MPIGHTHDYFVRTAMADSRVAREFFTIHLPKELQAVIDLNHLILQPRSHINEIRQETIADLLYKTLIGDQEGYLYLLVEHQSTPDKLMPFRILKYICQILDQHLKNHPGKTLPLIYPLVLYHSEKPYPYSTDIKDLVAAPKELVEAFFLKPFHLVDLAQIDDAHLKQQAWAGAMQFVLKHIFKRDILPYLADIMALLQHLTQTDGKKFVEIVLEYVLIRGEISNKTDFFTLVETHLPSNMGDKIMSLADQLKAEGRLEGKQEGKLEGRLEEKLEVAKRLLKENVELPFIAKITGLPLAQLKELQIAPTSV